MASACELMDKCGFFCAKREYIYSWYMGSLPSTSTSATIVYEEPDNEGGYEENIVDDPLVWDACTGGLTGDLFHIYTCL